MRAATKDLQAMKLFSLGNTPFFLSGRGRPSSRPGRRRYPEFVKREGPLRVEKCGCCG